MAVWLSRPLSMSLGLQGLAVLTSSCSSLIPLQNPDRASQVLPWDPPCFRSEGQQGRETCMPLNTLGNPVAKAQLSE